MDVKDFERYLELVKLKREYYSDPMSGDKDRDDKRFEMHMKYNEEFDGLQRKLVKLLFENQSSIEAVVVRLKNTLSTLGGVNYSYNDPNKTLNEIKVVKEIFALLDTYDWKLMHSEYATENSNQVAIWEQNGDGQIRNHKVFNIIK